MPHEWFRVCWCSEFLRDQAEEALHCCDYSYVLGTYYVIKVSAFKDRNRKGILRE